MSWAVQDVRWTGNVTQHSDTSLEHDGTFSLDGSTTIPQGSTIALLVNGWQPLIPMSSMTACWSYLNRFCSWNAASQVHHTVPIYSNMLSVAHLMVDCWCVIHRNVISLNWPYLITMPQNGFIWTTLIFSFFFPAFYVLFTQKPMLTDQRQSVSSQIRMQATCKIQTECCELYQQNSWAIKVIITQCNSLFFLNFSSIIIKILIQIQIYIKEWHAQYCMNSLTCNHCTPQQNTTKPSHKNPANSLIVWGFKFPVLTW